MMKIISPGSRISAIDLKVYTLPSYFGNESKCSDSFSLALDVQLITSEILIHFGKLGIIAKPGDSDFSVEQSSVHKVRQ